MIPKLEIETPIHYLGTDIRAACGKFYWEIKLNTANEKEVTCGSCQLALSKRKKHDQEQKETSEA